ncbi:MAG: hypothetical protein NTY53_17785 [Kiritimatiellaeota bacterium]|nr:hypothetical protein [Kiritimatiellota bacterium]
MNANENNAERNAAQAFSKAWKKPVTGFPRLGKVLSGVRLMCACCYCRQPGGPGGCNFA